MVTQDLKNYHDHSTETFVKKKKRVDFCIYLFIFIFCVGGGGLGWAEFYDICIPFKI